MKLFLQQNKEGDFSTPRLCQLREETSQEFVLQVPPGSALAAPVLLLQPDETRHDLTKPTASGERGKKPFLHQVEGWQMAGPQQNRWEHCVVTLRIKFA